MRSVIAAAIIVSAIVVSIIALAEAAGPMGAAPGPSPSPESLHHATPSPSVRPPRPPSVVPVPRPVVPPIPSVKPLPPEKQELVDAVVDHINTTQRGQGLSKDFIQMADPTKVREVITNNVDSVTVDGAAARPETKDNWTNKNSNIKLNQPPKANPEAAMHELLHSGNFAQGGDGIRDARDKDAGLPGPDGDSTNLVPSGFGGTLNQAKILDARADELLRKINSGTATKAEVDRFRNTLDNWSTRAQEVKNDKGMQKALDALGGKYDPQGYVDAVKAKLDQAAGSKPPK
jgi:hypothetical protein